MRADLLPTEIPSPGELRRIRESLGLSQAELAHALGFQPVNGETLIRRWEKGIDYRPTNTAWQAIRYLVMVMDLYDDAPEGPERTKIGSLLPECLR